MNSTIKFQSQKGTQKWGKTKALVITSSVWMLLLLLCWYFSSYQKIIVNSMFFLYWILFLCWPHFKKAITIFFHVNMYNYVKFLCPFKIWPTLIRSNSIKEVTYTRNPFGCHVLSFVQSPQVFDNRDGLDLSVSSNLADWLVSSRHVMNGGQWQKFINQQAFTKRLWCCGHSQSGPRHEPRAHRALARAEETDNSLHPVEQCG